MIDGEGVLEPVGGEMSGVPVPADVVDQHIDPRKPLQRLLRQPAHLGLGRQVGDEHVDLATGGGLDLSGRLFGAVAVAASDREVCAEGSQSDSGRLADAAAGTGDQHRLARHRPVQFLAHELTPSVRAGPWPRFRQWCWRQSGQPSNWHLVRCRQFRRG